MTGSPSTSERRRRRPVWLAALLGGVIAALLSLAVAESARRGLFDDWQRLAPRPIGADKVAVVLIERDSLARVGP